ncbi:hypothetical protein [Actinoplanes sp. NPDC026623]|uniref:hypothetical protein n=1 Tax=Actinoplanes sp. NPDC026623 TaxID=3155610 RepID=UPI0033C5C074
MTMQEPNNPPFADVDIPDTQVIDVAPPSPVFVDSTGRRRRLLRRVAYGFGALCMVYGGLISVSLAGGPVSSSVVLPLPIPGLADDSSDEKDIVLARPSPTPVPATTRPNAQPILEVFPRRGAGSSRTTEASAVTPLSSSASPKPSGSPSPKPTTKKPTPKPTTPKPAESGTTSPPVDPGPTETTTNPAPPPPAPPPPPANDGGSGGGGSSGGGGGSADTPVSVPEPPKPPADDPADADPAPATTSKPQPRPQPDPVPDPSGKATP